MSIQHTDIAIIGSGFGGIGIAIQLQHAGMHNIVLLEKKESNVFIKYTNVPESKDNYIIVNKFAKDILKSYLKEQRGE